MRIAVIGTGVSGLVAARHLHREHEVVVFEANDYIGGHTATVEVEQEGVPYRVDTGFIVFNDRTYPNFVRLLDELGVASQPSAMSFSVKCENTGLEWNGTSLNTVFAQRRNLFRPSFHRMLREVMRFNRTAPELLDDESGVTLGEYLAAGRYAREFVDHYLVPMGAAIWSAGPRRFLDIPARFFVRFFHHHGMLTVNDRPQWRVVRGGSKTYVEALVAPFRDEIRLSSPVRRVTRAPDHVAVHPAAGPEERFDQVIFATHSDQALRLLGDPTAQEREILGALPYQPNEVVLHTDASLMPRRRRAWASWNYHVLPGAGSRVAVTYNMNILQGLVSPRPFLVTLNRSDAIDPGSVLRRFVYDHPVFTREGIAAQARWGEISGVNRTHYCGAYWFFGFHEDGVRSGLRVGEALRRVPCAI